MRRSTSTVRISPPRVSSLRLTSRPSQREGESKPHDLQGPEAANLLNAFARCKESNKALKTLQRNAQSPVMTVCWIHARLTISTV